MTRFGMSLIVASLVTLSPAYGEDTPEPPMIEELDEFAQDMRRMFEGWADDLAPMMEDLGERLKGLNAYHPPEILPNGDIIIRRKTPEEITPEDEQPTEGIDI